MNRIFLDMDGVVVDFESHKNMLGLSGDELKVIVGAYQQMQPMSGAIAGVRSLIGMGFDVWLATKPPTGIAHAYGDKASWVFSHLPELKRKLIITHDKGLLGDEGDWLIDDRPHKANCRDFQGTLIVFGGTTGWGEITQYFRICRQIGREQATAALQAPEAKS